ncbi:MAG: prepilin-type N-terminal cleavage/methylation domain-containing protein [Gemmatimonadetes bacterium]|nr:prepilin-type N-terminal cleavage/methylation domain-containing protein [Gemmatimonadota bacterium]
MLNRKGFTLIELLIVVVIIGILAAIAIPKFSNTKEKAYVAAMKSDLRNLVTAEESYFADTNVYGQITDLNPQYYNSSAGVTVGVTPNAGIGFWAQADHPGTTQSCRIHINDTPIVAPAVTEGAPGCG